MPIFEYICDTCEVVKDKLVTRAEVDSEKEFKCECEKGGTMRRHTVPTAATLRFKGRWFGTTGGY